ncbi:MAG: DUF3078 domain-containing protein [Fibrobacteraceae bacterium]|nr:DUF3078 domain-containing protein [Fibrobacteraceae bacterium]MCF0215584.1 DUF3078 domain-containing protein [Fibrobacteraceae bacterium]MCF0216461.1 DUF3078 domain-containing protein [Fibrobacteraceae bacterium]
MKKSLFSIGFALLVSASAAFAEGGTFEDFLPENWTADVVASVKYTRMHYSNWVDGGTSTYTWLLKYDADVQGKWAYANWRNLVNLAWGEGWTDGLGKRKSEDKIFWESTVDFNVSEKIKPYLGGRYETQFSKTYAYDEDGEISDELSCFMDPVYLTQFAGLAYIPNDNFSQRLAFANRMTISHGYGWADDADTEDEIEEFRDEPGLESITEFKYAFSDIMNFKTRLWGFVNFKGVDEIDGKWENTLSIMLVPFIELTVGFDMAYDKDQDLDAQYKNMVLFGITWRWF